MKPANGSQSDEIGAACVRGRRPHSLLLREMAERRSTDVPDYGVSGPTRRYALIVGMLVALATVPTLVVLAVGAIWVGDRQSGGTPPRGASTGDPVIVLSPPSTSPRASSADSVAVPPAGPTVPPAAPRPAPVAVAAVPAPAPRRPVTQQATPAPTTPPPTAPPPTPADPAPV